MRPERFPLSALLELGVIIAAVAIAYASNRHRMTTIEHHCAQQEALVAQLSERAHRAEQHLAVLESRVTHHDKRLDMIEDKRKPNGRR